MSSLFALPDEQVLAPVLQTYPCRERQIRTLATLLWPDAAPCRNLVLHGTEATGKTSISTTLLSALSSTPSSPIRHAIVDSTQCITARHLFERIVGAVADALEQEGEGAQRAIRRCETLAQLTVEMRRLMELWKDEEEDGGRKRKRRRFVLVLDGVDRQKDAPPTMLPALARLAEIIPNLTTVFIVTAPPPSLLRTPSPSQHLLFPPYTKPEFVRILALSPPAYSLPGTSATETNDLWARFCAAVHDALVRSAARSLTAFRRACVALWPRFTAPVVEGLYEVKEFSKLLVRARVHFQDESILNPGLVAIKKGPESTGSTNTNGTVVKAPLPPSSSSSSSATDLAALLPTTARMLLLCAYLASHNPPRHDLTLFSTYHHGRKRRRGGAGRMANTAGSGAAKHRKIARKLLGAHSFVLERMMAIFAAVRTEWLDDRRADMGGGGGGLDGDVGMALATLASLRLLVRVGGGGTGKGSSLAAGGAGSFGGSGDVMDRGGKWRINVGWEVVRGLGRSIGVEVEEWLIE
ncbi:AAA ATPase domain-containing protein [Sarocladium implicatum]|nr:AAA ATPase domain-containing protein [Sarocladium implicatum]